MRHHVIISGTGRAGTTFLVELLGLLGIDTGRERLTYIEHARAGLEYDLRRDDAPYVVKSPYLTTELRGILESGGVAIDHAIVPVRDIGLAARSRLQTYIASPMSNVRKLGKLIRKKAPVAGGLWDVRRVSGSDQEEVLRYKLSEFMVTLAQFDIPLTLLHFPRLVEDTDYLFGKLKPVFPAMDREAFAEVFAGIADPAKVTLRVSGRPR